MRFIDKLNTILEVFDLSRDPSAMSDVHIDENDYLTTYTFMDHNIKGRYAIYTFNIRPKELSSFAKSLSTRSPIFQDISDVLLAVSEMSIPDINTKYYVNLDLISNMDDGSGYDLTNLGNAKYVYGKVLACLYDYMRKHDLPAVIMFSAWDYKTIPIYKRLMNLIAKEKGVKYSHVSTNIYILESLIDKIGATNLVKQTEEEQAAMSKNIKSRRAYERQGNLSTPGRNWSTI